MRMQAVCLSQDKTVDLDWELGGEEAEHNSDRTFVTELRCK